MTFFESCFQFDSLSFEGMCMCLSLFNNPKTQKPLLAAGYENGQMLLWDVMEEKKLSKFTVHSESGNNELVV